MKTLLQAMLCVVSLAAFPTAAAAQQWSVRGFFDAGAEAFTAKDSFEAVLGSATGTVFGGGAEVTAPGGFFAGVRLSQFRQSGERVFVFEGETFRLGIETTVTIQPFEITGGYRFGNRNARVVPYAGGGLGWHRFQETSEFAEDDENVDERFRGYHVLGGADVRVTRWFRVGGEAQWTTVPDALGQDPNSVSAAFEETNLGGAAFRVRVVVGR
jgi:opacity protein-like surface antigen